MINKNNKINQTTNASSSDEEARNDPLKKIFNGFKSCLNDIWSLEINTMVVSDIGGLRFNPINFYRDIYKLPDDLSTFKIQLHLDDYADLLDQDKVPSEEGLKAEKSLKGQLQKSELPEYIKKVFKGKMFPDKSNEQSEDQDRESIDNIETTIRKYIVIKDRLRLAYRSCAARGEISIPLDQNRSSETPKQEGKSLDKDIVPGHTSIIIDSSEFATLPLPNSNDALSNDLFENSVFLRELRSLRELYYLVGGEDATDSTNFIDLIAAQTVIDMDGDVINRFHKALIHDGERDFLIQTHQKALSSGLENWKNLVKLIIESIKTLSKMA